VVRGVQPGIIPGPAQGCGAVAGSGDVAVNGQSLPAVLSGQLGGLAGLALRDAPDDRAAPSAANARAVAVARLMPVRAPVTNATLPANGCWLLCVKVSSS